MKDFEEALGHKLRLVNKAAAFMVAGGTLAYRTMGSVAQYRLRPLLGIRVVRVFDASLKEILEAMISCSLGCQDVLIQLSQHRDH